MPYRGSRSRSLADAIAKQIHDDTKRSPVACGRFEALFSDSSNVTMGLGVLQDRKLQHVPGEHYPKLHNLDTKRSIGTIID